TATHSRLPSRVPLACTLDLALASVISSCTSFFFNDTAPTEIYTLSLHDALPIFRLQRPPLHQATGRTIRHLVPRPAQPGQHPSRSEEHTSELQSRENLVCRLLLEKKKKASMRDRVLSPPLFIRRLHIPGVSARSP